MGTENTFGLHDVEFINSLRNGDFVAYNELFKKYYPKLCNYIYGMEQNRSLAEDIVQETFIILWEKRKNINADLSVKAYLYKICHNEFLKYVRTKNKERAFLDEVKANVLFRAKVDEEHDEDRIAKLRETIAGLPPRCKEAFILSKFEKLKYSEIAERMGISKKTVEVHISKAFTLLREQLISVLALLSFLGSH